MKLKDIALVVIGFMIIVAFLGGTLGWPDRIITLLFQWAVAILIGAITSAIAGTIVEAFSGGWLKLITLNVEIGGFEFSISVFFIVTTIIKHSLFG